MKKIFIAIIAFFSLAFADFEGVIENIDHQNKTITVNGMMIKVLPNTQIEEDHCWLAWDVSRKFVDLKIGDIVELDLTSHSDGMAIATKIEIQCVGNKAY